MTFVGRILCLWLEFSLPKMHCVFWFSHDGYRYKRSSPFVNKMQDFPL